MFKKHCTASLSIKSELRFGLFAMASVVYFKAAGQVFEMLFFFKKNYCGNLHVLLWISMAN